MSGRFRGFTGLAVSWLSSILGRWQLSASSQGGDRIDQHTRYDGLFRIYAEEAKLDRWGLTWQHLKAQAIAESALDPDAVSPAGAKGLMQFMPATFMEWTRRLNIENPDPFNAAQSIQCGAHYMAWLLERTGGSWEAALICYNWGIGNWRRWVEAGAHPETLPEETKNYVARIEQTILGMLG